MTLLTQSPTKRCQNSDSTLSRRSPRYHDPKIDDPALRIALASDCFYVGALGSMTSQGRRAQRLAASGVTSAALARLRAPMGSTSAP